MGLSHDFFIIPDSNSIEEKIDIREFRKHKYSQVIIHDNLISYILDSLKWIKTFNPSKKEFSFGINYYGESIFKKDSLHQLLKIIDAWIILFQNAPDKFILKGNYEIFDDNQGSYEKIEYKKESLLRELTSFKELIKMAVGENMMIVHFGI